jgi:hypothetical protein
VLHGILGALQFSVLSVDHGSRWRIQRGSR